MHCNEKRQHSKAKKRTESFFLFRCPHSVCVVIFSTEFDTLHSVSNLIWEHYKCVFAQQIRKANWLELNRTTEM